MQDCPLELVQFAHRLADVAGAIHRRHFRKPVAVETKPDGSPVTAVDRGAEGVIRELIERCYPGHGIGGEEYGSVREDAEFVWHIDPLDGTKLFLSGVPLFGILIALSRAGRFILGLVDQPVLRERWSGADGHGSAFNGRPVRTRPCPAFAQAAVCTGGPDGHAAPFDAVVAGAVKGARWVRYGAECYDYGLVASGFMDVYLDAGLHLHDFASLEAMVRNAGGRVTDWQGNPLTTASDGRVLAVGDERLLDEVLPRLHD
jgi:inositol-phosphate phosphatase/L-galactose 1-phosphate phosphatase/histidinol-phosphatase